MVFIGIKVGNIPFCLFHAQSPLAAVAGNILTAALEAVDGKNAVVDAAAAAAHGGRVGKADDLIQRKHGGFLRMALIPFPCDQGRAEGAHDPGDIRTDGVSSGDFFKAS